MNTKRFELMVGFFVLLAITIFFIFIFFISGIYFFREGYQLNAEFDYVAGLDKGAPVRMAGVPIGEVNGVTFTFDVAQQKPKAVVDLWIQEGVQIALGSRAYVFGAFALNETLIEILPPEEAQTSFFQDGDVIVGVSPRPMELVMERGLEIADDVQKITEKIGNIMGDKETQEAFQTMIIDMSELLEFTNRMVLNRESEINTSVGDVGECIRRLRSILENINEGKGSFGKFMMDDELYERLNNVITALDEGKGTAGKLVNSDELYEEVKALIREIKLHPWRLLKRDKK